MKKALHWIMLSLGAVLLILYLVSELTVFAVELPMFVVTVLLLVAFVLYSIRYGGIRCPSCGCRINSKYGRRKAFGGRFPCPRCGAMIEL